MVWLLLAALLGAPTPAVGEQHPSAAQRPAKVGLALSGGAAKGFAHIGVLRVLEEHGVRIDAIAGTSMGSLVGGLYAIGYTPDMLREVATEQDWEALFTDSYDRRSWTIERKLARRHMVEIPVRERRPQLPAGLVAGQRISQLLVGLTWSVHAQRDFRAFPISYVAVATDLETGDAVPLDRGFLPEAMRASMSIPSVFVPVRIGDRVLVDGGLSRNLPAADVRDLGAELVICSDVSQPLAPADSIRTLLDVLDQSVSFRVTELTAEQRRLCDVLIEPEIAGLASLDFGRAAEWIERGEVATRRALPAILALVGRTSERRVERVREQNDSIYVDELVLEGLQAAPRRPVAKGLSLDVPGWLTRQEVDDAIGRAFGSGHFASVSYSLDSRATGDTELTVLTVRFEEEQRDRLGFNFRYETRYKASLLMSLNLRNLLQHGSVTRLSLRLGQQLQAVGQYLRRSGPKLAWGVGGQASWSQAPIDFFEDGRRVAEAQVDVVNASGFAGIALGNAALVGLRVKGEYAHARGAIAAEAFDEKETYYTIAGIMQADTYDRDVFPSRGLGLFLKSEWADRSIGSGLTFSHHVLDLQAYLPVQRSISIFARLTLGTSSSGDDLPIHYLFFLGGASPYYVFPDRQFPFFGLETQERGGRHLQSAQLGVQLQLAARWFAIFRYNAGNTFDRWDFDVDAYTGGYGLTLGLRTPFGPASATLSETTLSEWPYLTVDLGFPF